MNNVQNSALLTNIKGEQRISSELIADSIGTTYKSTNSLILKHKERLKSFGSLPFQKDAKGQKIPAYLNEDQAIFLMTLSKNTELVVELKHQLVAAYSKLRKQQAKIDENKAKAEWQQNRALGKLTHRSHTDTLKAFIAYAVAQGSTGYAKHGYSMFSRMVNQALSIASRDLVTEHDLHLVATADLITERVIRQGMLGQLPYKTIYQLAKHEVKTFAAMVEEPDAAYAT